MAEAMSSNAAPRPGTAGWGAPVIPSWAGWVGLILLAVAAAGGLWVSHQYASWLWHLEGDAAAPYLFWNQLVRDGMSAVYEWRYSQDNYLFSLFVPDILIFSAIGPSTTVLLMQGWVIFVGICLGFFLLMTPIAGRWLAGVMAVTMLFAGPGALGSGGFLTYPVTHNVAMLWAMAGLLAFMRWARTGGYIWLALGVAAQFVGLASDPWLLPTFVLPIALAGVATAVLRRERRWAMVQLALVAVALTVLARNHVFGLLWFLPDPMFHLGTLAEMWTHLGWVLTYLTIYFNVVPVSQPPVDWIPAAPIIAVNCVVIAVAMGWAMLRVWRFRREMSAPVLFLAAMATLGCLGITAAYILSNVPSTLVTGRYPSNWFFLLPVLMACAMFGTPGKLPRLAVVAGIVWTALFVTAGLVAVPGQLTAQADNTVPPKVRALVQFLDENGLTYGYAPFWATDATAVEIVTDRRIVVRPLSKSNAGHIWPRTPQAFPAWYEPSDAPPGQKTFFFVAAPDDEICGDVVTCEAMARRDFGTPDRVLNFQGSPVLVWNRPFLTGLPPDEVIAGAPTLASAQPVEFQEGKPGVHLLWRGWAEPDPVGTWTDAGQAVILIHLPDGWAGDAVFDFTAYGFFPGRTQHVNVSVEGRPLATWAVERSRDHFQVRIPADLAEKRRFALVLDLPDAVQPGRRNRHLTERRRLGIHVEKMVLWRP